MATGGQMSDRSEGRLGRPLSETPEYWRAAPEVALHWSAEEFGFPDQRRAENFTRAGDADIGHSAAGHLRAAGMRI